MLKSVVSKTSILNATYSDRSTPSRHKAGNGKILIQAAVEAVLKAQSAFRNGHAGPVDSEEKQRGEFVLENDENIVIFAKGTYASKK